MSKEEKNDDEVNVAIIHPFFNQESNKVFSRGKISQKDIKLDIPSLNKIKYSYRESNKHKCQFLNYLLK